MEKQRHCRCFSHSDRLVNAVGVCYNQKLEDYHQKRKRNMTTQDYRTRSPLRIFLSYFKPHWKLFSLDMGCAILIALVDLAFPLVSRAALYQWLPRKTTVCSLW